MNKTVESYRPMVDFLGTVLGCNNEIVLHDFTDLNHSVVDIRNGHVSGRGLGAPATDFALRVLSGEEFKGEDHTPGYLSHSVVGKPLRSASFFIKEGDEVVGMLCINTDTTLIDNLKGVVAAISEVYPSATDELVSQATRAPESGSLEHFTSSAEDLVAKTVAEHVAATGKAVKDFTPAERIATIRGLNNDGVFLLKGAVAMTADALDISEPSVYRYLQKVKKEG